MKQATQRCILLHKFLGSEKWSRQLEETVNNYWRTQSHIYSKLLVQRIYQAVKEPLHSELRKPFV